MRIGLLGARDYARTWIPWFSRRFDVVTDDEAVVRHDWAGDVPEFRRVHVVESLRDLVNTSDVIVIFWDGRDPAIKRVLNYAMKQQKRILSYYPDRGVMTEFDPEGGAEQPYRATRWIR